MTSQRFEAQIRRRADSLVRQVAGEIVRLREDAGLSQRAVAVAAGLDPGYLSRVETAAVRPTIETYTRIAAVLGADTNAHLYPTTGPTIHDRHQARIVEAVVRLLDARWQSFTEVAVRRPSRGWIDVVLHDPSAAVVVATEVETGLRRLEQLARWSREKADSLPSWEGWTRLPGGRPTISRLLIVRRTRANSAVGAEFERLLELTWPAHPADAIGSLVGTRPWPGPTLVWARSGRDGVRLLPSRG
jgi:transcriptional regulator with XRE-family HTH domain